jgi:Mrp family chromosome partitioning ATPase/uncharacterized protein involved in exopolysaccharide biosynthesis
MDFIYLFRVLMKKKWIILGAALIASIIAFVFTRDQQKKYRSFAQISTGFTIADDIRINTNSDNFSYNEADIKFNNVLVTCTSPTVVSLLSYTLILHDLQDSMPFRELKEQDSKSRLIREIKKKDAIRTFSNKLEAMSPLNSYRPNEKQLLELLDLYGYDYKDLIANLTVYRLQRTDYIQLEFLSENPELSAFVVNTVYQQFLRYYRTVKSDKSQESIDTLRSLLEKKKQQLDAKNESLRNEGMLNVGQENTTKFEMIMNLEQKLTEVQTKQTSDQYSLQRVAQQLSTMGISNKPNMPPVNNNSNDELLVLRRAKDDAYLAYINSGSADEALRKKYESLKNDYSAKVASSLNSGSVISSSSGSEEKTALLNKKGDLEDNIKAENANIESIKDKIAALNVNLVKDASEGAALQSLLKDAELANKEYLDAKQRFNDANDILASSVNNFRQILLGQPPIEPESSKRILIIGLAGIFVMVISVLVISLMTYLDTSLKTPAIFAKTVNLKLISMINFTNLHRKSLFELIIDSQETGAVKTVYHRDNVFRESVRKLRYEIESSGKKTFLFASTKKGEGKTTLIQILAFSLSQSKKKILIIDTNFSNNDLTVQLNAEPILENIHPDASNPESLLKQVRDAAKNTIGDSVYVIGSKGGDYTPSEILPRENLLQYLPALTAEYDYIFLEGPPLNDFSDAKELSQYVEGVIAVFSSHHIIKQIDKQSMGFFNELNGKFCGAILNMVDLKNVNVV